MLDDSKRASGVRELFFAQIGKTPALSRSLQRAFRPRRIVCIGSGGCTALSLLDDELEDVFSVDMNPAQCALLELKKESMRELDLEATCPS